MDSKEKPATGKRKPPNAGKGRPKGSENKVTRDARALFATFVEKNASRAQALFDEVASEDPGKALDLLTKVAEFVIPKLARTDVSGELRVRASLSISG